jgi:tripartite-type tricarboxylate transporter receptor subunit TctC
VKSVEELILAAKAKGGQLAYSSPGNGTPPHLSAELFARMSGIQAVHVPYKGAPAALTGVIAGDVAFMFGNLLPSLPHVQSGRLRALGVTSPKRSPALAGTPTIGESGVPSYESGEWYGVVAPAGVPAPIVAKLGADIARIAHLPEYRAQFQREGTEPIGSSPEQFAAFIRQEREKWARVAKASGAKLD